MSDGTQNLTTPGLEITRSGLKAPSFPALRIELTPETGMRPLAQKSLVSALLPEAGGPEMPSRILSTRDSAFAETREIASRALDAAIAAGAPPTTAAASVTQYKDASIWAAFENLLDDMEADLEAGAEKAMSSDKNTTKRELTAARPDHSSGFGSDPLSGKTPGANWGKDDGLSRTDPSCLPESEGRLVNRRA